MFEALSPIHKDLIFKVMKLRDVKAGEAVIKEGEQGDDMYLVDSGHFLVYKKDENGLEQQIFAYTEEGAAFGELSLMYGKPRAASVIAKTNGKLWSIGRAAFRAVMMRGKAEGLLEIYQTVPVLSEQSIPALHRLCLSSKELHFEKGDIVVSQQTMDNVPWELCIILTGVMKLLPKNTSNKRQLRAELAYFSIAEIDTVFTSAIAESKLKISCISREVWKETVGREGIDTMRAQLTRAQSNGIRLKPIVSPFVLHENVQLDRTVQMERYSLDHAINFIADYGYFGNYAEASREERVCTMKVYAKSKVHAHRMEKAIFSDRNILSVISKTVLDGDRVGLPTVLSTCCDKKWTYMLFKEHFVSDLGMAISSNALHEGTKPYLMACLYSAMTKVHRLGLIHRLINTNSCFITSSGTLQVRTHAPPSLLSCTAAALTVGLGVRRAAGGLSLRQAHGRSLLLHNLWKSSVLRT